MKLAEKIARGRGAPAPQAVAQSFPDDAMAVIGAFQLQEKAPDALGEARVSVDQYHEAIEELLLWMRQRDAMLQERPPLEQALTVMKAHARRRRFAVLAAVLTSVLTIAVIYQAFVIASLESRVAVLSESVDDVGYSLKKLQYAYLDLQRESQEGPTDD